MKYINKWFYVATIAVVTTGFIAKGLFEPTHHAFDYEGNADSGRKVLSDKEGNIYVALTGTSDSNGTEFVLVKYTLIGSSAGA